MAVLLMEGFDHLDGATFTAKGWSAINFNSAAGRFSGRRAQSQNTVVVSKNVASTTDGVIGFAFYTDTATVPVQDIFVLRNGTTNVTRIAIAQPSVSKVLRVTNAAGTTLCTGTTALAPSTWYYIELRTLVHASTGAVELRLNGILEASASSVNTGSLAIDNVGMNGQNGVTYSYDDMYFTDTTGSSPTTGFLGDVRVETLVPTGNGANTAWGGTTGTYTDWDDTTTYDSDTTYVSSSTPGDKETSTLADLTTTSGTVFAVQTNLVARKDDAGTRTIAPVIRISGTDYDGTTSGGLGASYVDYTQLYSRLDPAGNAWTIATVNAMEAGVKEVA